jgi:hypothetical protein
MAQASRFLTSKQLMPKAKLTFPLENLAKQYAAPLSLTTNTAPAGGVLLHFLASDLLEQ